MTINALDKSVSLGNYLRENRIENGKLPYWSLRAVSKRAGMSMPYLSQLEKGIKVKVDARILKNLSLVLQIDYGKLIYLCGYIDQDVSLHKESREIPVLGEVKKNESKIITYDCEIKESLAVTSTEFPSEKKLAAVRIKTPIEIFNTNFSPSDVIIIPLSHITIPLEDIIVLKKF
jgi:transcriptional regulator with XRE-family HTH domain